MFLSFTINYIPIIKLRNVLLSRKIYWSEISNVISDRTYTLYIPRKFLSNINIIEINRLIYQFYCRNENNNRRDNCFFIIYPYIEKSSWEPLYKHSSFPLEEVLVDNKISRAILYVDTRILIKTITLEDFLFIIDNMIIA